MLTANGMGLPTLMQHAGEAVWRQLQMHYPAAKRCLVLCGAGNNGGDGWVVARLAKAAGLAVTVLGTTPVETLGPLPAQAAQAALAAGVRVLPWPCDLPQADVIVDALLGIGFEGGLRPPLDAVINAVIASKVPVVSVDLPSGLMADSGLASNPAIKAALTVTLVGHKVGLHTAAGRHLAGLVVLECLGSEKHLAHQRLAVDVDLDALASACKALTPKPAALAHFAPAAMQCEARHADAHKGCYGHVLIAGGDDRMLGASLMAAKAAYRVGAGKVSLWARRRDAAALVASLPACMVVPMPEDAEASLGVMPVGANVLLMGPGMGRHGASRAWYHHWLSQAVTHRVMDADALYWLSQDDGVQADITVITPHPGEAATLLSCQTGSVQADRLGAAQGLADRFGCVCVLKGAGTVVASPGSLPWVLPVGGPALAKAGSGDVLAGVIAALLGQGVPVLHACVMAVGWHALAGDRAQMVCGSAGAMVDDCLHFLSEPA